MLSANTNNLLAAYVSLHLGLLTGLSFENQECCGSQKITKRVVDGAEPMDKDVYVWDSDIKGFGLKVTLAGRKVYIYQYCIGGKRGGTRRMTFGVHGGVFTSNQA